MYMFEMLLSEAANADNAKDNKNLKIWVQVSRKNTPVLFTNLSNYFISVFRANFSSLSFGLYLRLLIWMVDTNSATF